MRPVWSMRTTVSALGVCSVLALSGCGSAAHTTATHAAGIAPVHSRRPTTILLGCHPLPFPAAGVFDRPAVYDIQDGPQNICFRYRGTVYSSTVANGARYEDPFVVSDLPRSGEYFLMFNKHHRYWYLIPVKCPCS
jgi:hypothetical protein